MVAYRFLRHRIPLTLLFPDEATYEDWLQMRILELTYENDPNEQRRAKDRQYRKALEARRRGAGKCRSCERSAQSASYCAEHRADHARRMRRWRLVAA